LRRCRRIAQSIFRRWSKGSSKAHGRSAVLKEILSGEVTEVVVEKIHDLLSKLGEAVRAGQVDNDDFIIYKVSFYLPVPSLAAADANQRLGKNPEDYPDKKSQPHVQVALRMKARGGAARAHDVIPYIICLGEDGKSSKSAQADRAFHPDDLHREGSTLKIGEYQSQNPNRC
jgi:DNA polymerase alpha subunit A